MEEKELDEDLYAKRFNEGYAIAQHMPDLAEQLAQAIGNNAQGFGFADGRNQFLQDKQMERRPSWLKESGFDRLANQTDKEPDKDKGIEPEV